MSTAPLYKECDGQVAWRWAGFAGYVEVDHTTHSRLGDMQRYLDQQTTV